MEEDFNFVKRAITGCTEKPQLKGAKRLIFLFYCKHSDDYYESRLNDFYNHKCDEFIWF
jgi:hypothetical protein